MAAGAGNEKKRKNAISRQPRALLLVNHPEEVSAHHQEQRELVQPVKAAAANHLLKRPRRTTGLARCFPNGRSGFVGP